MIEEVKEFVDNTAERLTVVHHDQSLSIVPNSFLKNEDVLEDVNQWIDETLQMSCAKTECENPEQLDANFATINKNDTESQGTRRMKRKIENYATSSNTTKNFKS